LVAGWSAAPPAWKAPFEGTLVGGWSAGARSACHARQERTDIDVYGRNTSCVASIVGVQISLISKEMKFILGTCYRFFFFSSFFWIFFSLGFAFLYCSHVGVSFFFQGGFERVNLSYAFFSSASIFPPPVPISLYLCSYLSTLASSTLIILFSEMLKVESLPNQKIL